MRSLPRATERGRLYIGRILSASAIAPVLFWFWACGGAPDNDSDSGACDPGAPPICACEDGTLGRLMCAADSSAAGPCACEGTSTSDATSTGAGEASTGTTTSGTTAADSTTTAAGSTDTDAGTDTGNATGTTGAPEDAFCPGGLVRERLDEAPAFGEVVGGSFIPGVGWRTTSPADQIAWDLGQTVRAGSLSFKVTGIHADVGGCLMGVCYYVGLFDEASGDKGTHYDGAASIESRFHTNQQENFHDVFKLQAGIGDGQLLEPLTPAIGWSPAETHTIRVDWGPLSPTQGRAWLYIDDQEAALNYPAFYSDPDVAWRYLLLGTTNYKGLDWGMIDVTYSDLCLVVHE